MPELPEIEALRRSLEPALVGSTLQLLRLGPHDMRARGRGRGARVPPARRSNAALSTRPAWINPSEVLHGARVCALHRHGKQLAIEAEDGRVLVVQLGMSGQLLLETATAGSVPKSHRHIEWRVVPPRSQRSRAASAKVGRDIGLVLRDPRRFGGVHAAPSLLALRAGAWSELGADALDISAQALRGVLRGRRAIKALLLDQRALAGVGNIYADESLFRARINPSRDARGLSAHESSQLAAALRFVLRGAVARGGSTLRDYRSATGAPGTAQIHHAVYGRRSELCVRCRTVLRGVRLAGRATVWCPACQPVVHRRIARRSGTSRLLSARGR